MIKLISSDNFDRNVTLKTISTHCDVMSHCTMNMEIHNVLFIPALYELVTTLAIHGFWTKALKLHGFLKKESFYYIGINLTKHGFALHGFFLEPKSAYLEALL